MGTTQDARFNDIVDNKQEGFGLMKNDTPAANARQLAVGALLTSLALVIPLVFRGWLQVYVPMLGLSATLASHVPSMLAMFVSPFVAVLVGVGSVIGFAMTLGPVIAARAASHIAFGLVGAMMVQRGARPVSVLVATLPVHALLEGFAVWLLVRQTEAAWAVAGLTVLHHAADAAITLSVVGALARAGVRLQLAPASTGKSASSL